MVASRAVLLAEPAATEVSQMLLAAALLVFSFPQNAPAMVADAPAMNAAADAAKVDAAKTDSSSTTSLPSAPAPKNAAENSVVAPGESSSLAAEPIQPAAAIQPANPPKVAIRTRIETPTQKITWIGLAVVGHGAAAFDAYSTRQAISGGYGSESNPLLRPFSHSNALYIATQVSPSVMDFLGHKMMTNKNPWVRKMWWVPQTAGAGISFSAGAHNMSLLK
jgi:hypothetical protein